MHNCFRIYYIGILGKEAPLLANECNLKPTVGISNYFKVHLQIVFTSAKQIIQFQEQTYNFCRREIAKMQFACVFLWHEDKVEHNSTHKRWQQLRVSIN